MGMLWNVDSKMAGNTIIAFHGTNKVAAESIYRTGFRKGTYFAFAREDAIKFGGPYVFSVRFSKDPKLWRGEPDGWQFWLSKAIGPEVIDSLEIVGEKSNK